MGFLPVIYLAITSPLGGYTAMFFVFGLQSVARAFIRATFDRVARQAVCAWGAAPAAGQDSREVASAVKDELERAVGAQNVVVSVRVEDTEFGLVRFTARMEYSPTLFGLGLRREIFGIALPPMTREVSMVVDAYKPGVLF